MRVTDSTKNGGRSLRRHGGKWLVLATLGLLAGCQNDPEERAPTCPLAYLRPDAATLTRTNGRGTDLTDLVLSGRLVDVKGACKGLIGGRKVAAQAQAQMVLTRGPAATGRDFDVPYIVGVVEHGQVLEKKAYMQHVSFPPNVDTVQVTGEVVEFSFPTPKGLSGANYSIYFLFDLSPAELQANQRALTH